MTIEFSQAPPTRDYTHRPNHHKPDGSHDMATRPPLLAEHPQTPFDGDDTQRIPVLIIYLNTDEEAQ